MTTSDDSLDQNKQGAFKEITRWLHLFWIFCGFANKFYVQKPMADQLKMYSTVFDGNLSFLPLNDRYQRFG